MHVQSWLPAPGVLVLRYEALQADFEGALRRLVDFLSLPTLRSLAEVQEEYVDQTRNLLTGDNRAFHRKGIVGDWKNYCDDEVREVLKNELGETLIELGYEQGLDW